MPSISSDLERRTEPPVLIESDEGAGKCRQSEMDFGASLIADSQGLKRASQARVRSAPQW